MQVTGKAVVRAGLAVAIASIIAIGSAQAQVLKSGTFRGAGGHKTSGQVSIVKSGGRTKIVLAKNFRLDGAPDPKLAFGNGKYVRGTIFAKLRRIRGKQEYVVPKRLNPAKFSQVWLWCERYNVPLGVANIR